MLYVIGIMFVLCAAISSCNIALRSRADTKLADCRTEASREAQARIEAGARAERLNTENVDRIRKEADAKRRAAEAKYAKTKAELDALRKRQAVPKECKAACREDLEPVARFLEGMKGDVR